MRLAGRDVPSTTLVELPADHIADERAGRRERPGDEQAGQDAGGDPTAVTLAAHQELVVTFGTSAQLPSPIPSAYPFPPGL